MTPQQKAQRAATHRAAQVLREYGIECEVREFFVGKSTEADAAGICLRLAPGSTLSSQERNTP